MAIAANNFWDREISWIKKTILSFYSNKISKKNNLLLFLFAKYWVKKELTFFWKLWFFSINRFLQSENPPCKSSDAATISFNIFFKLFFKSSDDLKTVMTSWNVSGKLFFKSFGESIVLSLSILRKKCQIRITKKILK